jgi:hypothetical protein
MGGSPEPEVSEDDSHDEFWQESRITKKAVQDDYRSMMAKGMKLIHGKETRANILKALQSPNPVDAVSNITVALVTRLDQAMRKSGKDVVDEVKAYAANSLMGQILEVGEASGTIQLSDDEKEVAFSDAVNKYMRQEIAAGRIDKGMLAEESGRSIAEMSEEQRAHVDEQMKRIGMNAEAVQKKYGQISVTPQEKQMGGLLDVYA